MANENEGTVRLSLVSVMQISEVAEQKMHISLDLHTEVDLIRKQ